MRVISIRPAGIRSFSLRAEGISPVVQQRVDLLRDRPPDPRQLLGAPLPGELGHRDRRSRGSPWRRCGRRARGRPRLRPARRGPPARRRPLRSRRSSCPDLRTRVGARVASVRRRAHLQRSRQPGAPRAGGARARRRACWSWTTTRPTGPERSPTGSPRSSTRVEVLHRPRKAGLGRAYVAGFEHALLAGAELVIEMDADFSHDPADLPRLVAATRDADLVLGSRYVEGGGVVDWGLAAADAQPRRIDLRADGARRPGSRPDRGLQVLPPRGAREDRPGRRGRERVRLSDRAHLPGHPGGVPGGRAADRVPGSHRRALEDDARDSLRGRVARARLASPA